jgi:hypothetical protein
MNEEGEGWEEREGRGGKRGGKRKREGTQGS